MLMPDDIMQHEAKVLIAAAIAGLEKIINNQKAFGQDVAKEIFFHALNNFSGTNLNPAVSTESNYFELYKQAARNSESRPYKIADALMKICHMRLLKDNPVSAVEKLVDILSENPAEISQLAGCAEVLMSAAANRRKTKKLSKKIEQAIYFAQNSSGKVIFSDREKATEEISALIDAKPIIVGCWEKSKLNKILNFRNLAWNILERYRINYSAPPEETESENYISYISWKDSLLKNGKSLSEIVPCLEQNENLESYSERLRIENEGIDSLISSVFSAFSMFKTGYWRLLYNPHHQKLEQNAAELKSSIENINKNCKRISSSSFFRLSRKEHEKTIAEMNNASMQVRAIVSESGNFLKKVSRLMEVLPDFEWKGAMEFIGSSNERSTFEATYNGCMGELKKLKEKASLLYLGSVDALKKSDKITDEILKKFP